MKVNEIDMGVVSNDIAKFLKNARKTGKMVASSQQEGAFLTAKIMSKCEFDSKTAIDLFRSIVRDDGLDGSLYRNTHQILPIAVSMLAAGNEDCPPSKHWESGNVVAGVAAMQGSTLALMANENTWESDYQESWEKAEAIRQSENKLSGKPSKKVSDSDILSEIRKAGNNSSGTRKSPQEVIEKLVETAIKGDSKACAQFRDLLQESLDSVNTYLANLDAAKGATNAEVY